MPTVTVDETSIGQILATDGALKSITLKTVPTQYGRDYFSLVNQYIGKDANNNDVVLQENSLYTFHVSSSPVSPGSVLMTNGRSLFSNLVLKDIPPGCSFDIEYGTPPPPPTLTSLSPNTVVSGDPDFTLSCIGTGFNSRTVIKFGNYDEPTTLVSDTEVTTGVKPSLFAPAVVPVLVHDLNDYSASLDFTFTEPAGGEE
jgi:hypothetical protein